MSELLHRRPGVRAVIAEGWFDYAVKPGFARQIDQYFGMTGDGPTEDEIREEFGEDALRAWCAAREARIAYYAAVRAALKEGGGE